MICGGLKKKKHWADFYHYRVIVYTRCQDTFKFKHHVKVNFASDVPFKKYIFVQMSVKEA